MRARLALFATLILATGCPIVTGAEHQSRVDADGDGYFVLGYEDGDDCDDTNAGVHPGAEEVCDDGHDNNCDGSAGNCGLTGTFDAAEADSVITPASQGDKLGAAVANVGDVDGDGKEDLWVAAPGLDGSYPDAGGAYLFLGQSNPTPALAVSGADLKVFGSVDGEAAGSALAGAGDIDGDGLGDMLLGAPDLTSGDDTRIGAWYLVLGPDGPAMSTAAAYADGMGKEIRDRLGTSLCAGELDGAAADRDVAVGAPFASDGGNDAGSTYIFAGPVLGTHDAADADVTLSGAAGDSAGTAVVAADFDGDGADDLLIGAPTNDGAAEDAGTVYFLQGPAQADVDLSALSDGTLVGMGAGSLAGTTLASGDLDGDGNLDAVIGAPEAEGVNPTSGAAFVVLGPLSGQLRGTAGGLGQDTGDQAGAAVAVGDADGDGIDDLAVGAPDRDVTAVGTGAVYLLYGPVDAKIALGRAGAKVAGSAADDYAGASVALVDFEGKGSADLLFGAWGNDDTKSTGGAVYLFLVSGI